MKLAVIGSRNLTHIELDTYIPKDVMEIVSGGAVGVDTLAADYAKANNLTLTELLPEYGRYGRAAPIVRNKRIVDHADKILVFRNGSSKGTLSVIEYAKKTGKPCEVILCSDNS